MLLHGMLTGLVSADVELDIDAMLGQICEIGGAGGENTVKGPAGTRNRKIKNPHRCGVFSGRYWTRTSDLIDVTKFF